MSETAELLIHSGQLRAIQKELHDRGVDTINLRDLLEELRVGPLQRPASEYVGHIINEIPWPPVVSDEDP